MSLSLLKRTAPKSREEEGEVNLPLKRKKSFAERYNQLIQDEMDQRLLRKQKKSTKKPVVKSKKNDKSMLEKIEENLKNEKTEDRYEKNLKILQGRTLPMKYVELLSKKHTN